MSRKGPEGERRTKAKRPATGADPCYLLCLFVAGATPRSITALANLKTICEESLHGRYRLEVIDIYQQPSIAKAEQILATPTLIRRLPTPIRRIVGDLSAKERVLIGLGLRTCST